MSTEQTKIAELLSQAGSAHHIYEQSELNGVYDEAWATWYADYVIQQGINEHLGNSMTVEQLAQTLAEATEAHTQSDQSLDWAAFTAAKLNAQ